MYEYELAQLGNVAIEVRGGDVLTPLNEAIRARTVREAEKPARGNGYATQREALLEKAEQSRKGGYSLVDMW